MLNRALLSSRNEHYCTPPSIIEPMLRLLRPRGSGRRLLDPASNSASIVPADIYADGITVDGLALRWSEADAWVNNPPYGRKLPVWVERQVYWGSVVGVPGLGILPSRTGPKWVRMLRAHADAWCYVSERQAFWVPIAIHEADAPPPRKRVDDEGNTVDDGPYYLRRWYPDAEDGNLPEPFRSFEPGFAVGPELGKGGRPQPAPFDSLLVFFAHPETREQDPQDELAGLRELVRYASHVVRERQDAEPDEQAERWLGSAEMLLGSKRFASRAPLDLEVFDRLAAATKATPGKKHAVGVREFYRHFHALGDITINKGPHKGTYPGAA